MPKLRIGLTKTATANKPGSVVREHAAGTVRPLGDCSEYLVNNDALLCVSTIEADPSAISNERTACAAGIRQEGEQLVHDVVRHPRRARYERRASSEGEVPHEGVASQPNSAGTPPAAAPPAPTESAASVMLPNEKGAINWLRVAEGRMALWHRPGSKASVKLRQIAGATMLVTLLAEREGAESIGRSALAGGLEWLWFPLDGADLDYLGSKEAIDTLTRATTAVVSALRRGASVVVHCSAGIHRTGSVGYTVLRASGLSSAEAHAGLMSMRPITAEGVDQTARGRGVGGDRTALVDRHVLPRALEALEDIS